MTLKEKKFSKQEELKALEAQIAEGDAEAIKSSETLVEEIKGLDELIQKAESAQQMIKCLPAPATCPSACSSPSLWTASSSWPLLRSWCPWWLRRP